jgi:hypothetical protein
MSFLRPQPIGIISGIILAFSLALGLAGCGYVGDPLPPALYIPLPVTDLSAAQEGDAIVVRFTMPARSTEDLPLGDEPEIDLRAAALETQQWDEPEWDRRAFPLQFQEKKENGVLLVPAEDYAGQRLFLRVRVAGKRGRYSAWSSPVALQVVRALQAPSGLKARATSDGVELSWDTDVADLGPTTPRFEIWRRLETDEEFTLLELASASPFVDARSSYDRKHSYRVRVKAEGQDVNAISEYSETVDIVPVDVFPPAPPADLSAVAGVNSVELSWSRNLEPDFSSYRVHRAIAEGEFQPLGEPLEGSSFSDTSAPAGVTIRYRVTALDTQANESVPSEVVEVVLPQ